MPASPDTLEIRELPQPLNCQPADLPAIPGGWTEREWTIKDRSFRLILPAVPDAFLDDPDVHRAFEHDEYMPYWAFLWPAALKMASTILSTPWPAGAEVLELGAGIGIVALAGLSMGLSVTISDYEPKAVELALANAPRNGFREVRGQVLDWRSPPDRQYPFLWGCELLYEDRNHEPLLNLTKRVLTDDGVAWFADGGRMRVERFCRLVPEFGLEYELFDEHRNRLAVPRAGNYQMIEVRHRR